MNMVNWAEASEALRRGEVMGLPTDTVYGLAAALSHPSAVRNLFDVKRRPSTTALPVMVADIDMAHELATEWNETAECLSHLWPGALTLIVPTEPDLAAVIGGDAAVGLRIPDDNELRSLLRQTGPLAVTSANSHGQPPCTSVQELLASELTGVGGVVDGGTRGGAVSTVVDTRDPWRIVREGALTGEVIRATLASSN
jgi:L-threonylcarbamoyladenylate synthase